jgi:hypothetical protein
MGSIPTAFINFLPYIPTPRERETDRGREREREMKKIL